MPEPRQIARASWVVAATVFVALIFAVFTYSLISELPKAAYRSRGSSAANLCERIRTNMSVAEVLATTDYNPRPYDQRYLGDRMVFSYHGMAGCSVEFDAGTRRVNRVSVSTTPIGWKLE
jgi:hypothetical protein